MPDDTNDEKLGLGGGVGYTDPHVTADIAKLEELRLSLDRLAERLPQQPDKGDRLAVTRTNIVELLNCLHATLNSSLLTPA